MARVRAAYLLITSDHWVIRDFGPITNPKYVACDTTWNVSHSGIFSRIQDLRNVTISSSISTLVGMILHLLGFKLRLAMIFARANTLYRCFKKVKFLKAAPRSSAHALISPPVARVSVWSKCSRKGLRHIKKRVADIGSPCRTPDHM